MPTATQIEVQINEIIAGLIQAGLVDDQNFAFQRELIGGIEVTFSGSDQLAEALKETEYEVLYGKLVLERAYLAKMLDGALVQVSYEFYDEDILSHRLAFFPSPYLPSLEDTPDIYEEDKADIDMFTKKSVGVPLRFDYQASDSRQTTEKHPKAHLTLGQYKHCRIATTSPLTAAQFMEFILENFYQVSAEEYAGTYFRAGGSFPESIAPHEREGLHIAVPKHGRAV